MNIIAGNFVASVFGNTSIRELIVAFTVSPADGFISRLLQQTQQAAPAKAAASNQPATKPDQTTISTDARQAMQSKGNQNMESRLMDLYNQKGGRSA